METARGEMKVAAKRFSVGALQGDCGLRKALDLLLHSHDKEDANCGEQK